MSNTAYSIQLINTTYALPLDTAYQLSGTETEIFDFRANFFLPSSGSNLTGCLSLVSGEEEEEEMAETMEQYMSKTRTDYRSIVARPKIDNKDQFELKGQFLKELREKTFSGSDNADANEHTEKSYISWFYDSVAFHKPIGLPTGDGYPRLHGRVILFYNGLVMFHRNNLGTQERGFKKVNENVYAAQVGCEQCKGPPLPKDSPLKKEGKTLKEAYYTQLGGPFQGGGYRATALGYYQRNNANPLFQERRQSMEDTLSKFMSESAKRHEENSNLIKEIRASTDAAIRNQGASIKTLEIQIGQMSKVLQERGFRNLPSSTKTNPRDQVKSISTSIKADSNSIRHIGSNQYAVSTRQNSTPLYKARQTTVPFPSHLVNHYCEEEGSYGPKITKACGASHINNAIPRKEK
ncbi:hypothetical protein Tco_0440057 [Tanacetum coccineum]